MRLHHSRLPPLLRLSALLVCVLLLMVLTSCAAENNSGAQAGPPIIRVRLLEGVAAAHVGGSRPAIMGTGADSDPMLVPFPPYGDIELSLDSAGWHLGANVLPNRGLLLQPGEGDSLRVNGSAYRGNLRFVPTGAGTFDVINEVTIDDYLKGVVAREMYPRWSIETFKSQAIAARTFALFIAATEGRGRSWDVYPDERSQMYGGIAGETERSSEAVDQTAGITLVYGPGEGKIFCAYFSSCCGGIAQSAADAFADGQAIEPLSAHSNGTWCAGSGYFNWGPITVSKGEISRRMRGWMEKHGWALSGDVERIDIAQANALGRPTWFFTTDVHGNRRPWRCEDFRAAVNFDGKAGTTLPSSFCKVRTDGDSITFYEGHGSGHGVGLCQWTAHAQAEAGEGCEQILMQAYPGARLERAY